MEEPVEAPMEEPVEESVQKTILLASVVVDMVVNVQPADWLVTDWLHPPDRRKLWWPADPVLVRLMMRMRSCDLGQLISSWLVRWVWFGYRPLPPPELSPPSVT